jgi:hypothetical protein
MTTKKRDDSGSVPANLELSLETTLEQSQRTLAQRQRTLSPGRSESNGRPARVDGYNPYDGAVAVESGNARRKPKDLRKLSEWIRTQRRVETLKKQEKP